MEDLRYPIGNFEFKPFSNDIKNEWLKIKFTFLTEKTSNC
jgi:hypothetical protein